MDEQIKQYFTPDISDLRIGYEFEAHVDSSPIEKGWYPATITEFDKSISFETGRRFHFLDINGLFYVNGIRVPYLTQQQIESEGYEYASTISDCITFYYNHHLLDWDSKDKTNTLRITKILGQYPHNTRYKSIVFDGQCRDINTLRYIQKLLNIK